MEITPLRHKRRSDIWKGRENLQINKYKLRAMISVVWACAQGGRRHPSPSCALLEDTTLVWSTDWITSAVSLGLQLSGQTASAGFFLMQHITQCVFPQFPTSRAFLPSLTSAVNTPWHMWTTAAAAQIKLIVTGTLAARSRLPQLQPLSTLCTQVTEQLSERFSRLLYTNSCWLTHISECFPLSDRAFWCIETYPSLRAAP